MLDVKPRADQFRFFNSTHPDLPDPSSSVAITINHDFSDGADRDISVLCSPGPETAITPDEWSPVGLFEPNPGHLGRRIGAGNTLYLSLRAYQPSNQFGSRRVADSKTFLQLHIGSFDNQGNETRTEG